jgi:hypothetical protein
MDQSYIMPSAYCQCLLDCSLIRALCDKIKLVACQRDHNVLIRLTLQFKELFTAIAKKLPLDQAGPRNMRATPRPGVDLRPEIIESHRVIPPLNDAGMCLRLLSNGV